MYNAALTVALPPHTARLPRKTPESLLSGATPTKAASCLGGRLPSSGSSAKSVLATTGPTPGTPRKSSSFSRQVGLLAIALRALSPFVRGRPWQLFGLSLPKGSATTLQLPAVFLDQGRSRSVAPARSILRPLTRYKGRSYYAPTRVPLDDAYPKR